MVTKVESIDPLIEYDRYGSRMGTLPLFAVIGGLASFDPRREAFGEIVACHQGGELLALDLKPLGNCHVEAARDRGDDAADRARRMSDDAPRQAALPSMMKRRRSWG